MLGQFLRFRADVSGAVSVDWIVLTAAIALLGVAAVNSVRVGVTALTEEINLGLDSSITE